MPQEEELAYLLKEVCQTLVYLHGQGTLHRDVKGSNIVSIASKRIVKIFKGKCRALFLLPM